MIKKFMCDKVDSESVNWVDENNRLVWFDFSRQCREQFGYKYCRYNFDWRGVKKLLKGRYVLSRLRANYRKLYHHPGYSDEKKDEFFQKMRYGDFLPPYEPCSAYSDVFTLQTGAIADIKFRRQE